MTARAFRAASRTCRAESAAAAAFIGEPALGCFDTAPATIFHDCDKARRAFRSELVASCYRLRVAECFDAIGDAVVALGTARGSAWVAELRGAAVQAASAVSIVGLAGGCVHTDPTSIADDPNFVFRTFGALHGTTHRALTLARRHYTGPNTIGARRTTRTGTRVTVLVVGALAIRVAWRKDLACRFVDTGPTSITDGRCLSRSAERELGATRQGASVVAVNRSAVSVRVKLAGELTVQTRANYFDGLSTTAVEDLDGGLVGRAAEVPCYIRVGVRVALYVGFYDVRLWDIFFRDVRLCFRNRKLFRI